MRGWGADAIVTAAGIALAVLCAGLTRAQILEDTIFERVAVTVID